MPELHVYTDHGQMIAHHPDACLAGVDLSDSPIAADYAEIITPSGIEEYFGRIVVCVFSPKKEDKDASEPK